MTATLAILILIAICVLVMFYNKKPDEIAERTSRFASQLDKLWKIQNDALKTRKIQRAEKALLMILRVDERNAAAYNRLGMIFAKQHNYNDAIECFEIAQSLDPTASSFHNVGLVHMEKGDLEKAVQALKQAVDLEPDLAFRHISYAQVLEKIGDKKTMIEELEKAVELEPTPQILKILAEAYDEDDRVVLAASARDKARDLDSHGKNKTITQPNKAVI